MLILLKLMNKNSLQNGTNASLFCIKAILSANGMLIVRLFSFNFAQRVVFIDCFPQVVSVQMRVDFSS